MRSRGTGFEYRLGTTVFSCTIQGQLLRKNERREVAIFLRNGSLWVADFIDNEGKVIDATTWFRFNCGALSSPQARQRMVLESAIPLSRELVERIERLPQPVPRARASAMFLMAALIAKTRLRRRLTSLIVSRFRRGRRHLDGPSA